MYGSNVSGKFALTQMDTQKQLQKYLNRSKSHFQIDQFKLPFFLHPCQHLLNAFNSALDGVDFAKMLSRTNQKMICSAESSNFLLNLSSTFQNSSFSRLWRTFSPISIFGSCFKDFLIRRLRQAIMDQDPYFKPMVVYRRQEWKVSVSIAAISFRFHQKHPPKQSVRPICDPSPNEISSINEGSFQHSSRLVESILVDASERNHSISISISPNRSPLMAWLSFDSTLHSQFERLNLAEEESFSNSSQVMPAECLPGSVGRIEEETEAVPDRS